MGKALAEFIKRFGRKPKDQLEWLQFRFKLAQESGKGKVVEFPRDKITDWRKPRPTTGKKADVTELDEPLVNEFAGPPHGYGAGHGTANPIQAQRIRQGFSTQSKLNSWSQNQRWVSDFIGKKNAEFNFLNKEDQTKVLEMFEAQIKKHMPKERKAGGGIAGMLGEPTYADDNHRVPYDSGNMVLPKEKPSFQGLFHTEVGGPVIGPKDDSMFEAVVDRWSQFARQQGAEPEDAEKNKMFALENIYRLGREQGYEDDEIKLIIQRVNKAEGGRVPFSKGKRVLEGLAKLMDEFFPGTTKLGKRSRPFPEKVQEKMDLRKALTDFQGRQKNKKYTVEQETKISSEQVGSLDEFHADFVKETGINIPKENLKNAWDIKKSYPFNTPIIDKTGKFIGGEATQKMYPKSKKFIVKDEDQLTKEIDFMREGKLPSGERAGIDVPPVPEGFKLSREKLIENFPEIGLDEIDEIMKLDKETQARMIMMLKNRRLDPDLYDELLLKHGDTLEFQGEFDKAIRRKKNASGGIVDGRVGLLWGGGIFKTIIKNLAKERGVNPSTYLKITNYKALPNDVKKYISKEEFERMKKGRIEMFENWVEMAKTRKAFLENIEQGKKTPAAPIFEHLEKSFKSPVPPGVTDKDILQGEFILKNLKTKDRKLNASGGLAEMLGE
tara:strand:+ start:45 stop:2042 length:1998 start_codon:yes stop_codon:yes gene_type:complete